MHKIPPVTPGELLLEEFLKPMGISQYRLAKEVGVSQRRIGQIVAGQRAITVDAREGMADTLAKIRPWIGTQAE